jgi:hypothetical protein
MNATSEDVKDMLVNDSSLALTFGTNLFIGMEPAKPRDVVTIFDTPGFPPYLGLTDTGYEYPSVQIRVRSHAYMDGMDIIERIKNSLHGRAQETWNDALYSVIYCSSGPALLDWDENANAIFIINFNLQRTPNEESV